MVVVVIKNRKSNFAKVRHLSSGAVIGVRLMKSKRRFVFVEMANRIAMRAVRFLGRVETTTFLFALPES